MRTRIWLPCGVLLALCVALLLLRGREDTAPSLQQPSTPANEQTSSRLLEPTSAGMPDKGGAARPAGPTSAPKQPEEAQRSNADYQAVLAVWRVPIDFYGKVVDENSNAVSGASVSFRWFETPLEGAGKTASTQSDAQGLFSLRNKHGQSVEIRVAKEGYYALGGGRASFAYSMNGNFTADSFNPVVFRLRKKGGGTHLLTSENGIRPNVAIRIPLDNTPVRVDLLEKRVSAIGQLQISQEKPPWREAANWSFRMSIPDGGFVENDEEFQFDAPENKYQSRVEYHFTRGETNWATHVTKQFYIAFGEPRRYGWLRIESDIAQETVFLTYAINPSGSRNLEPSN